MVRSSVKQVNLVLPLSPGDTMLVGLPIFHVNAANATGLGSIMAGATILMTGPAGFRSAHVLPNLMALLIHFDVSIMMAVPTVYAAVVESLGNEEQLNLSALKMKLAISGAAPLSPVLKQKFTERVGIPLVEGYGATETTAVSSLMPINDIAMRQSVGLPLPTLDLKIANIDERGELVEVCEVDQVGEIVVAGPNVFQGYLEPSHNEQSWITLPDKQAKGKRYFRTGDLGCLDQHGYLSLAGRQKELIIRGGHNIDPKMIEDIASKHPAVSLAAAVGRPDAYAGEVPVLYVTYAEHQQASETEILEYVSQYIPERAATPKQVIALSEMPTTAIGKIFKPQLNCYQVESVVDVVLTEIDGVASEDIRVSASPSKQFGLSAQILLSEKIVSKQPEIEEALANFSFHYRIEQAPSTHLTSQDKRVA
ncbi:MAG: AMP-binding protein [Thalassotalea sp.]|nr:AMP-binding protein [Thalassotalea sp.]